MTKATRPWIVALVALLGVAALSSCDGSNGGSNATPLPSDTLITLERGVCFGACPVYELEVRADGTVRYRGNQYVAVEGQRGGRIDPDDFAALVDEFERIGYFNLDDEYPCLATDVPTFVTSITTAGRSKRVVHCFISDAPQELQELEDLIDEVTGSTQWIGTPAP